MICVPIVAANHAEAEAQIRRSLEGGADLVELRLDYLQEPPQVKRLVELANGRALVTCRSRSEGGNFAGALAEQVAWLQAGIDAGAAYVDAEAAVASRLRRAAGSSIIISRHFIDSTPSDLVAQFRELAALPGDAVKIAATALSPADNVRMLKAIGSSPKPAIGLCMGEMGESSRILNLRFGSLLTFASLLPGLESASGQIPLAEMISLYRVRQIKPTTKLYAVIGDPISHSLSPLIHNTAFVACNMDAVYLRFRVTDFAAFMAEVAEPLGLQGISVTIPHKEAALRAASEVNPLARAIGAVNTLTRTPLSWRGDNTDHAASMAAIAAACRRANITLSSAHALVLGAGGTSRAVVCGLLHAGCRVTIANRTHGRATQLAAEISSAMPERAAQLAVIKLTEAPAIRCDIVANTTSVGMQPHVEETPLAADIFRPGMVAFDAVYRPVESRFLREARSRGAEIATGLEMFIGQAARQFEIWTGCRPPIERMAEAVRQRL